jgi:sugar (pentulose or hexulose) kinase
MTQAARGLRGILLGVDIGTTACKIQAVDLEGCHMALASVPTPWEDKADGRQLDCETLLSVLLAAVEDVLARCHNSKVLGVGITGFAESGVLLDTRGNPLAPVLPWYDQHGAQTVQRIDSAFGPRGFAGITGLPLNLKPSIMKFQWLMETVASKSAWSRWLNVPEWVGYKLCGVPSTEPSLASRTGFFDVLAKTESAELLDCVGAPHNLISPLRYSGERVGTVKSEFGLLAGAAVTVCGMDHLVAGVGVGATRQDDLLDSCGTGEALIRRLPDAGLTRTTLSDALDQEIALGCDVFSGQIQATTSLRSGIGMWRFLKLMGKGDADIEILDAAALRLKTTEKSPVVDTIWLDTATLSNIGYDPDPAAVWRAAVESVQRRAFVLAARMSEFAGPHGRIIATGGGLRSLLVRELKRDILGPFEQPDIIETASRGAALFAGAAAEVGPAISVEPLARSARGTGAGAPLQEKAATY